MGCNQTIELTRKRLGISSEATATFVGISPHHLWDLESYDDEVTTTISLAQFSRLCGVLHLHPHELLGQEPPLRHINPSELRGYVLEECQRHRWSVEEFGEQAGWDVQGLIDKPDAFVLGLNLDGLQMICEYLGLSTIEAIPEPVAA